MLRAVSRSRDTGLRTVLFTDVVGSTELAREMGDVRWSGCSARSTGSSALG
jgi:class 3 adenylate cyclase